MARILLDSLDKRMTIPIVNYYHKSGYEIDGICFKGSKPLSKKYIAETHYISKDNLEEEFTKIIDSYSSDDYLIIGNPQIIEVVNKIKPNIKYIIPTDEAIDAATDKRRLLELAEQLGVKIPKELQSPKYPMVIKLNTSEGISLKPVDRYRIVKNEQQYQEAMKKFADYKDNIIMQEYVEGNGYGVSMLFDYDSNLIDYIVHERLLEYPIAGGPSALCKSTYNEQLVHNASKLLKELKWQGLAMVEFKGDTLIEINPRFWGSLPLLFVAESDLFSNLIETLNNNQKTINETQSFYKKDKFMSYFPQCWISILMHVKKGNLKTAIESIPKVMMSKEGILKFSNPAPFFRYLRTLK